MSHVIHRPFVAPKIETQELVVHGKLIVTDEIVKNIKITQHDITDTKTTAIILTNTSNQITCGTGTLVTINVQTTSARTITVPAGSTNCSFVLTEGAQTLNGSKTLSSGLAITATANQVVLGSGATSTITVPAPSASRVYTLADAGASASFVMTEGAQTLNGVKTFSSAPVFPSLAFPALKLTSTSNQLELGSGSTIKLSAAVPASSLVYTIPDAGANSSFILSNGAQTIAGPTIFSSAIDVTATSNQLVLGSGQTLTINAPIPLASRTYTMPDVGADSLFVMTEGGQLINGQKTFSSGLILSATGYQMLLGSGTYFVLNAPSPAASLVYSFPDAGASAFFIMSEGAQTINGAKTLTNATVSFPTAGGAATPLDYYEMMTGTLGFTSWVFTNTQTSNLKLVRLGEQVTLKLDGFETVADGSANGAFVGDSKLPTRFCPSVDMLFTIEVKDVSAPMRGDILIAADGTVTIMREYFNSTSLLTRGDFTLDGNNVGFSGLSVSWLL